jgi:hypothetical protein
MASIISLGLNWTHCTGPGWSQLNTATLTPVSVFQQFIFPSVEPEKYSCSLTRLIYPFPQFYIVFVYYWTCSRPEYSWNTACWTFSNNQSINYAFNILNVQGRMGCLVFDRGVICFVMLSYIVYHYCLIVFKLAVITS